MDPDALFLRDRSWFHPTALTTGPWTPDAMHGGPPCSLFGLAIDEAAEADEVPARINIDLERPVPLEPLSLRVARRKISRRVAHIDVELHTQTAVVASARALLLRGSPAPLASTDEPTLTVAGEEHIVAPPDPPHGRAVVFHRDAVEHRFLEGGFSASGPSLAWMRLRHPLVAGEPTGELSRLLAVADFGSAISQSVRPGAGFGMINVDVSVALTRRPAGSWFRLASKGRVSADGIGLALTELSDVTGSLGVATHSQLVRAYAEVPPA